MFVRIKVNKVDIMVGVWYRPNQDKEADGICYKQLGEAS